MSWRTGEHATVRCPRCGSTVPVPIEIRAVDVVPVGSSGTHMVRTWFTEQMNVTEHKCTDGKEPVERFVKTGELDDPLLP